MDAEGAVGIDAIELDHVRGDVLEKVAVVADDYAGEGGGRKQVFQPGNSREIEMVGGFVEEEDVGMLDEGFDNRQTLLPAAGEVGGLRIEIFKTGAAQGLSKARATLRAGDAATVERGLDHCANCGSRLESGILLDIGQAGALADGDFAGVGVNLTGKNSEESGFAGTVRADQADAVSFRNDEGNFLEERIGAEGLRDFLGVDYGRQGVAVS